jgi:hypothetical protein
VKCLRDERQLKAGRRKGGGSLVLKALEKQACFMVESMRIFFSMVDCRVRGEQFLVLELLGRMENKTR